jgi:hypothetical protein
MTLLEKWQLAANVATTFGVAGVAFAYYQFREGITAQNKASAVAAWNEYLRLALAHPKLSRPAAWLTGNGRETSTYGEYRWFAAAMFFACDQVLEAHEGEKSWEDIVKLQVRYHAGFLELPDFDESLYSKTLARICREVRTESNATLASQVPTAR